MLAAHIHGDLSDMADTDAHDDVEDRKGDGPDDLAPDAQSPAGLTNKEVEDTNLLTPKSHMEFIEQSNKRVEEERKAAEEAQRAQARALLNGNDAEAQQAAALDREPVEHGDEG